MRETQYRRFRTRVVAITPRPPGRSVRLLPEPNGYIKIKDVVLTYDEFWAKVAALDNPEWRQVLEKLRDGKKYVEIANEIGVALGTIRSRLHRARLAVAGHRGA